MLALYWLWEKLIGVFLSPFIFSKNVLRFSAIVTGFFKGLESLSLLS